MTTALFPARSRLAFSAGDHFDLNLAILTHCEGGNLFRIDNMKRFGVLNPAHYRVHILVIGSPGDFEHAEAICQGWHSSFLVSMIEMPSKHPIPKINGYYLWLIESGLRARWHGRVDDDSMTDIHSAIKFLDERFSGIPVHVMTPPICERERSNLFVPYLQSNGIMPASIRHESESSFTTQRGMEIILRSPTARRMLKETAEIFEAPGDRALAIAAHIAAVPVTENPYASWHYLMDRFTLLGGDLHHLHYVPWNNPRLQDVLLQLSTQVFYGVEDFDWGRHSKHPFILGRGLQTHAVLTFHESGAVVGGENLDFFHWDLKPAGLLLLSRRREIRACFGSWSNPTDDFRLHGFDCSTGSPLLLTTTTLPQVQSPLINSCSESISEKLCKRSVYYWRVGYDIREMTFASDGTIKRGSASNELTWALRSYPNAFPALDIYGVVNLTCRLTLFPDGLWRGEWRIHEKMPIVIGINTYCETDK